MCYLFMKQNRRHFQPRPGLIWTRLRSRSRCRFALKAICPLQGCRINVKISFRQNGIIFLAQLMKSNFWFLLINLMTSKKSSDLPAARMIKTNLAAKWISVRGTAVFSRPLDTCFPAHCWHWSMRQSGNQFNWIYRFIFSRIWWDNRFVPRVRR